MHHSIVADMITSRRQSKAIEMRSVFSSTIHPVCVVHIQDMSYFLTLDVVSHQSFAGSFPSHPALADCYIRSTCLCFSFLLLVGGRIVFFLQSVDGFWPPNMAHEFPPCSCYPAFMALISVYGGTRR